MALSLTTTGTIPKALLPGLQAIWGTDYTDAPKTYPEMFDLVTSEKRYEEDVEHVGTGYFPVKPEGEPITYDSESQGVITRYTQVAYGSGYVITHEAFMDNQYMELAVERTKMLAGSLRATKELIHADVYNDGFTTALADGVAAFSASHPTASGNQSNLLSVAADFSEVALEDVLTMINTATDSRGLRIGLRAQSVIGPPNLLFEANRILKSVLQNDTANNAINAIRVLNSIPKGFVMCRDLSDTDAWFVRTDVRNGFKSIQREDAMFMEDNDGDTMNQKYMAYERFVAGLTNWRGGYASAGA